MANGASSCPAPPPTPPAAPPLVEPDQATTPPPPQDAVIDQLRSENRRLWEEVEARREETRRLHILAAQQQESITALAGRILALAAGPPTMHADAPTASETARGAPEHPFVGGFRPQRVKQGRHRGYDPCGRG
jgi:hypothetical protein